MSEKAVETAVSGNQGNTDLLVEISSSLARLDEKVTGGLARLDEKITTGLEHLNEKITTGLEHLDEKITTGLERLDEKITTGLERLDEKITTGLERLDEKITTGLDNLDQKVSHLDTRMGRLETRVAGLDSSMTLLNTKVTHLGEHVCRIDLQLSRTHGKVDDLRHSVYGLQQNCAGQAIETQQLSRRVDSLCIEVKDLSHWKSKVLGAALCGGAVVGLLGTAWSAVGNHLVVDTGPAGASAPAERVSIPPSDAARPDTL